MGLACRSIKQDAAQRSRSELQPGSIGRMGLGSRHPILAPFGLLCFGPIKLPVSTVSIVTCCRQVTAGWRWTKKILETHRDLPIIQKIGKFFKGHSKTEGTLLLENIFSSLNENTIVINSISI